MAEPRQGSNQKLVRFFFPDFFFVFFVFSVFQRSGVFCWETSQEVSKVISYGKDEATNCHLR